MPLLKNSFRFSPSAAKFTFWAASLILPPLLYWGGLTAWFYRDDFALLSFRGLVAKGSLTLASALFAPVAQGTIRTLSERVYYLSFFSLFGTNALPYHILAFLTFSATLLMLAEVCTKLTASRAAGYWAAFLWGINSALAMPISWTAEYYHLLCAFFFLLDLWLLLRFVETGEKRYYVAQWITFILGFGVLEINVVYPALATVYVLCRAPQLLRKILPMYLVSAAYVILHFAVAPVATAGPYKMYWDWHILPTLSTYFSRALGSIWLTTLGLDSYALWLIPAAALTAFLVWKLRQRDWVFLLFPAWFVIVLAPLLPLREHLTYEYLTEPTLGLAIWAGAAVSSGFHARIWWKAATAVLLILYVWASVSITPLIVQPFHDRSIQARNLYDGLVPEKDHFLTRTLLLTGVTPELVGDAINSGALRLAGIQNVYVLNAEKPKLSPAQQLESAAVFLSDSNLERQMVAQDRAVVYDVSQGARDVTAEYRTAQGVVPGGLASRVEMGIASYADQLGPTWFGIEGSIRWMPKHATVRLRGPTAPGQQLYLAGFCPPLVVQAGPVEMQVSVDGRKLPSVWLREGGVAFSFNFPLPAEATGKDVVQIDIDLSRTLRPPGDARELGLAFSSLEIH
jgi:hypothetical protein